MGAAHRPARCRTNLGNVLPTKNTTERFSRITVFKDYFQQYTFLLPIPEVEARKVVRPALFEIANRIYNTPGYDFRHVSKKELPKFAEDFRIIYNKAWAKNMSAGEMTPERAAAIMQTMKPILEEELMWFGLS